MSNELELFLLTGSNLGNRVMNLQAAMAKLSTWLGQPAQVSSIYETAAWGKTNQNAFLNQMLLFKTSYEADKILAEILSIEKELGRVRHEKWGARFIDIDIIYYGDQIIDQPQLKIPHPHLQDRRFTLVPLAEISPLQKHPQLLKNSLELLAACTDDLPVKIFRQDSKPRPLEQSS
ncbi:MAG TPA: 2-amino-4-hydroxy-6-hydroxymethyldihydropteridine diphosphokinase [Cyclobacteriaceae bacterium]|nr:2-amino-4-hydroxy-6-hydroxymethyldihydropteridine diphosphokinase [Cyclobacteriaceae bacterium]